jgi:hypothetical protein
MNSRWLRGLRRDGSRRRSRSASAEHGHTAWAYVERLEERRLLTLSVVPITPVEGSLFQGTVATFVGNEVPANSILDYSATIDWGDGSPTSTGSILPGGPSGFVVNGSHTYGKEGGYNLSVKLSGIGGVSVTAVGTATVSDAPVIVAAGGISATANASFSGQVATFTDAGPDLPGQYVATITWGDGSSSPGTVAQGGSTTSFVVSGTHTYQFAGSDTYTVSVTNLAGTNGKASATAVIADPPPVLTAPTIAPVAGLAFTGVVANFTDANPTLTKDSFAATIDWGDNSPSSAGTIAAAPGGGFTVTGTHTYNTTGVFPDKITLYRKPDNVSTSATGSAVVNNPVITPKGANITPSTGLPFTGVVATFTDNNPSAVPTDYTASIDWGDGHVSAGTIANMVGGGFSVTGTNTYATPNKTFPLIVTIKRIANGEVEKANGSATVTDAVLTATANNVTAFPGQSFTTQIGTITDTNPSAMPSDYDVVVDWGDATTSTGSAVQVAFANPQPATGVEFTITATHTYANAGTAPIKLTVTRDANDQVAVARSTATITEPLPIVIAPAISPQVGVLFNGVVATFTDVNPTLTASSFAATIDWGDNSAASQGTIKALGGGEFSVSGSHVYNTVGNFPDKITIIRLPDNQSTSATGTAIVTAATSITGIGTTITPFLGMQFTLPVASFSSVPAGNVNDFVATIDWGDSTSPTAGTIQMVSPGQYNVIGTHTYVPTAGVVSPSYPITVTVVQSFSNSATTTTINSKAIVQTPSFTGGLSPLSVTGISNSQVAITSINQPTFSGTAQPYSLIQIYSRLPDQLAPVLQGSTVAGGDGSWSLVVLPLADGNYTISATVTPPGGAPVSSVALPNLVIDTVPPVVTGVIYSPSNNELEVVFRDNATGMNTASLLNPQNYNLIGHPQRRLASTTNPVITTIQIVPNDPQAVLITLNRNFLKLGLRTVRVVSGGVADLAGNALDGAYHGTLPSGSGKGGSNFVFPLSRARRGHLPTITPTMAMATRVVRFGPIHRRGR